MRQAVHIQWAATARCAVAMPPAAAAAADDAHSGQKVKFCGYICQSFLFQRDFPRRGRRSRRRRLRYRLLLFSSGMDGIMARGRTDGVRDWISPFEFIRRDDSVKIVDLPGRAWPLSSPRKARSDVVTSGQMVRRSLWSHPVIFNHSPLALPARRKGLCLIVHRARYTRARVN